MGLGVYCHDGIRWFEQRIAFTKKRVAWSGSFLLAKAGELLYQEFPTRHFVSVGENDIQLGKGLAFNTSGWCESTAAEILELLTSSRVLSPKGINVFPFLKLRGYLVLDQNGQISGPERIRNSSCNAVPTRKPVRRIHCVLLRSNSDNSWLGRNGRLCRRRGFDVVGRTPGA